MSGEVIEYRSDKKIVFAKFGVLDTKSDKVACTWSGQLVNDVKSIKYKWDFNWDELKKKGVDRLSGYIVAKRPSLKEGETARFDIELTENCSSIEKTIVNENLATAPIVAFEYRLTPKYTHKISENGMFAASSKTDAILVIEGKKLHVNKAFLSFHSDFFTALFSSNFKEGKLTEIPIKEVTYEDFALLMSTIYPVQVFPTDETSSRTEEKLLELADRFLLPSVPHIVEHHFLEHSKLKNEKLMWIADSHGMKNLLEKCIRAMDTVEKAKKLEKSAEFEKLSFETRSKLFQRILKIV